MSGLDNIRAITENLKKAVTTTGISVMEGQAAKSLPASRIPCAAIAYAGEAFEYSVGSRPSYAEAEFLVKVFLRAGGDEALTTDMQTWVHAVRGAVTAEALNADALALTRPVYRAAVERADVDVDSPTPMVKCAVRVRYREGV